MRTMSSVSKLIEAPAAIEAVALAIASDAYPGLRTQAYLAQLDEMVAKLKKRGHRKISRSALIRFALDQVDIRDFPRAY